MNGESFTRPREWPDLPNSTNRRHSCWKRCQTTTVTTSATADGTYKLWFVSPGSYDVSTAATIGGTAYADGPRMVTVGEDEDVTDVDFDL